MRTVPVVRSPNEESTAWAASLKNDENAFAVVFDLHRDRVYHHALQMTASVHDAEDVVAAAFFELWRGRKSVRVVDGSVLPWLLVTATNLSRNLSRGVRRYRALIASLPRSTEMRSTEDVAMETIEEIRLAANVQKLSALCRQKMLRCSNSLRSSTCHPPKSRWPLVFPMAPRARASTVHEPGRLRHSKSWRTTRTPK